MAKKKWIVSGVTGVLLNDEEKLKDIGLWYDESDAISYAKRKADRHMTKGKRRVKTRDYRYDYWI